MDLRGLEWHSSSLSSLQLENVDLRDAILPGGMVTDAKRSNFDGANLKGGFVYSTLDSTFRNAALEEAQIRGLCAGSVFDGAGMKGAVLCFRYDQDPDIDAPSFRGCSMDEANLEGQGWMEVDLSEATLVRSEWTDVDAQGATLAGCDLTESRIERSKLVGCDLSDAKHCRAQLKDVDLTAAKLSGADFTGAALSDVTLDPRIAGPNRPMGSMGVSTS